MASFDYTSFTPSFFLNAPGVLVASGNQFVLYGVDTGNGPHWQIFNDDVDAVVYSASPGGIAYQRNCVDTDGWYYTCQAQARWIQLTNSSSTNNVSWLDNNSTDGSEACLADVGGQKYVFFNTQGGDAKGQQLGCFTRTSASPAFAFQGSVNFLQAAQQSSQSGRPTVFAVRPSDGRVYMLSATSSLDWYLTSAPIPLNGHFSSTAANPDKSVLISLHTDAATPFVSPHPGLVYSPQDDTCTILLTDGTFKQVAMSTLTVTSFNLGLNISLNDTARLMNELAGVPNGGYSLAQPGNVFTVMYTNGSSNQALAHVAVTSMTVLDTLDLTTLGFPAVINTWFGSVQGVYLDGCAWDSVRGEIWLWPSYGRTMAHSGTHVNSYSPWATTHTVSGTVFGLGGPGATVSYSGVASGSVTADGSGNYTISALEPGAYTVTPSHAGFSFTPTNRSVTITGSDITGVNFQTIGAGGGTGLRVITGSWQYPNGIPVNGQLYLRLSRDAVTNDTNAAAPRVVQVQLESGQIPLGFATYANDQLNPAGTTYDIEVVVGGGAVWQAHAWSITGNSPINLNSITATP